MKIGEDRDDDEEHGDAMLMVIKTALDMGIVHACIAYMMKIIIFQKSVNPKNPMCITLKDDDCND